MAFTWAKAKTIINPGDGQTIWDRTRFSLDGVKARVWDDQGYVLAEIDVDGIQSLGADRYEVRALDGTIWDVTQTSGCGCGG